MSTSLESASGDELAARLQRYRMTRSGRYERDPRFDRSYRLLMELAKEYDIPEETVRNSGLPAMLIKFQSQGGSR